MAIFASLFDIVVLVAAPAVGLVIDLSGYTAAFVGTGSVLTGGLAG